jgi:hypothetical protein
MHLLPEHNIENPLFATAGTFQKSIQQTLKVDVIKTSLKPS